VKGTTRAGLPVEQNRPDTEGRRIAEDPADIVMVRQTDQADHQRFPRHLREQFLDRRQGSPMGDGQDAPVNRKAHDGIHHRPVRRVDRNLGRQQIQCVAQGPQPALRQQERLDPEAGLLQEKPQDDFAFRDEAMLPPDEIALADGTVRLDPRVAGV
jgi:hypothetical protein